MLAYDLSHCRRRRRYTVSSNVFSCGWTLYLFSIHAASKNRQWHNFSFSLKKTPSDPGFVRVRINAFWRFGWPPRVLADHLAKDMTTLRGEMSHSSHVHSVRITEGIFVQIPG